MDFDRLRRRKSYDWAAGDLAVDLGWNSAGGGSRIVVVVGGLGFSLKVVHGYCKEERMMKKKMGCNQQGHGVQTGLIACLFRGTVRKAKRCNQVHLLVFILGAFRKSLGCTKRGTSSCLGLCI